MLKSHNSFFSWDWSDLILNILGTAWAKKDSFWKIVWDKLKISVKKAPENWEATRYMIKFIAKSFWVSHKDIELLYWETSPNKAFKIKSPKIIPENLKKLIL